MKNIDHAEGMRLSKAAVSGPRCGHCGAVVGDAEHKCEQRAPALRAFEALRDKLQRAVDEWAVEAGLQDKVWADPIASHLLGGQPEARVWKQWVDAPGFEIVMRAELTVDEEGLR